MVNTWPCGTGDGEHVALWDGVWGTRGLVGRGMVNTFACVRACVNVSCKRYRFSYVSM